MTKARLHLLMFGIISVFLLSSFSIWRIVLDTTTIHSQESHIDSLRLAEGAAEEMIVMIQEIRALAGSWILLPDNSDNKARLKELQSNRIFLTEFKWQSRYQRRVDQIVSRIDSLIEIQNETIVGNLQSADDYEVPVKRLQADDGYAEIDEHANATLELLYELHDDVRADRFDAHGRRSVRAQRGAIILIALEILMFLAGLVGLIILVTSPGWKMRNDPA